MNVRFLYLNRFPLEFIIIEIRNIKTYYNNLCQVILNYIQIDNIKYLPNCVSFLSKSVNPSKWYCPCLINIKCLQTFGFLFSFSSLISFSSFSESFPLGFFENFGERLKKKQQQLPSEIYWFIFLTDPSSHPT